MENNKIQNTRNWMINFLPLWIAQLVSMLGSFLAQYAIIWWLTLKSGSVSVMAISTLLGMLPGALLGLFAGTVVDRYNRKWIMILSDGGIALMVVILIILFRLDIVQYWHIYGLMAIRSVGSTLHSAALNASISLMVPEKQLTRVSGMNQTAMGIIGIIAAPIAALLVANPALDFANIISIDVITALIAIISIVPVRIPQVNQNQTVFTFKVFIKETREAFPYIWQWKGMRNLLIILAAFSFFFMPLNALESLFVVQELQQDMTVFSIIESVFGVGFMMGGILLSIWGGFQRKILTILFSMVGVGIGLLLQAITPGYAWWLAVIGVGISGIFLPMMNGPVYAIIQSQVEAGIQGRIFALQSSLNNLLSAFALVLLGLFSGANNVRIFLIITSLGIVITGLFGYSNADLRRIEANRQPE